MRRKIVDLNFSQQGEIFSPLDSHPVTVIGVGSVGSRFVSLMADMGVGDFTIYDGDHIESHNIPPSAYEPSQLGMFKVRALAENVQRTTGVELKVFQKKYEGERLRGTVVACVDTMEARSAIWEKVRNNSLVDLFVDTRVAKELTVVYAIDPCDPEDAEYYEHFLYPSEDAARLLCGEHAIASISTRVATTACSILIGWWKYGKKEKSYSELAVSLVRV